MPFRKMYKRKRPNRPGRARKRRFRRRAIGPSAVVSSTSPVPDQFFTKLKYTEYLQFNTATGVTPYLYNMGGLYDPNHSGAGHQPFGFDQLAALYERYRVYGVKYHILIQNTSGTYPVDVAVVLKPVTTLSTDMQTIAEKPYTQVRSLGVTSNAKCQYLFKGYVDNPKLLGVSKERYRVDDQYSALKTANPVLSPYLHMYWREVAGTTGITLNFKVHLTYYCKFFQRVPLTGS